MLLTLSIGLVLVNLPLSSNAQNSALSQSGNSDSEQETKLSQSSGQNGQVISGDASILSGNNLACQEQENSEAGLSLCPEGEILSIPGTETLHIRTFLLADCFLISTPCPYPDGRITIHPYGWHYDAITSRPSGTTDTYFELFPGQSYGIQVQGGDGRSAFVYDYADIQGDCSGRDRCNAVMGPHGAEVFVYLNYNSTESLNR